MKEVFEKYGGILIKSVVILTFITVILTAIDSSASGVIEDALKDLIKELVNHF